MRKLWLILLPIAMTLAVGAGVYFYFKPKMRAWVLNQIEVISSSQLPMVVRAQDVNWSLLLPSVEITGLEVIPTGADLMHLEPLKVERVSASVDFIQLLAGRLGLSTLIIERPQFEMNIDPFLKSDTKPEPLPMEKVFDVLRKFPLARVAIIGGQVKVSSKKYDFVAESKAIDTLLTNYRDEIAAQLRLDETEVRLGERLNFPVRLETELSLTEKDLKISKLKAGAFSSVINASGAFTNFKNITLSPEGNFTLDTYLDLMKAGLVLPKAWKVPKMEGVSKLTGKIEFAGKQIKSDLQFTGKGLAIDQFKIGDLQFQGTMDGKRALIDNLAITSEAGIIDVKKVKMDFDFAASPVTFAIQGQVSSDFVDLHELLLHIGVGDVPVEAFITTRLNCGGPILPDTKIVCEGKADADEFEVRSGPKPTDLIASIDHFGASGSLTITQKDISYNAGFTIKETQGKSDGVISYAKGFKINYSSPQLFFRDVRYLAGLKLEGAGLASGSTEGDSSAATFAVNLKGKNIFFEDFYLGEPQLDLRYEDGSLYFENINGLIETTAYQAKVNVNLTEKKLWAQGQAPQFQVPDILRVFQRQLQLPIELNGAGSISATVEGPFELGKLSYDLNAVVLQGTAAGESFDRLDVSLSSVRGEAKINKAVLRKNKSQIVATGAGHPDGQIAVRINGNKMLLEESENISKLGATISGVVDFEMSLNGFILTPDTLFEGRVSSLNIAEEEFPMSTFSVEFTRRLIKGSASLVGGDLKTSFALPLVADAPFHLRVDANKWNYTTLFTLVGAGSLLSDYEAELTGTLDLHSEVGGIFNSTGAGRIEKLLLRRGDLSLENSAPMSMTANNGRVSLSNFKLLGDKSSFEMRGNNFSKDDLNLRMDGVVNLRLLQIFLPFMEELAGSAQLAVNVSGQLEKPQILGNAGVENGYIKIKGFPHAFERIAADVQFSQSKILINSFRGNLGGGTLEGDGAILIEGIKNFPMNIKASLRNASLDVPQGVRTTGDADVVLSGNWFPFLLSGTYRVRGGFFSMEIGETGTGPTLRQSSYLPKVILQSAFEPLALDLSVILEKPLGIKNSMVEGAVTGQLQVKGTPTNPVLLGRVTTTSGSKVYARDNVFDVQNASVTFTDPNEINPELYVSAQTRVKEYDVNLLVQGNAKNPVIRLSSVPPLSDQDIISLLALGITSQQLDRNVDNREQAKNTMAEAGSAIFGSLLGRAAQTYGFEFKVSSGYDDTKNIAVQRITIGRKINEKVNASATRQLGQQSSTEVKLQYSFNPSISAIGSWENREASEQVSDVTQTRQQSQSIFGLDLEFKKEFK